MKLDSRKSSEFLNGFYPSVFATLRPDEPGKPERSRALVAKGPQ